MKSTQESPLEEPEDDDNRQNTTVARNSEKSVGMPHPEPFNDWKVLTGSEVEVRLHGRTVRRGTVDAATADSRLLWLAADGNESRRLIDKSEGYEVLVEHPDARKISFEVEEARTIRNQEG
jgi:transcription elongation GreA/GreB family factor